MLHSLSINDNLVLYIFDVALIYDQCLLLSLGGGRAFTFIRSERSMTVIIMGHVLAMAPSNYVQNSSLTHTSGQITCSATS